MEFYCAFYTVPKQVISSAITYSYFPLLPFTSLLFLKGYKLVKWLYKVNTFSRLFV